MMTTEAARALPATPGYLEQLDPTLAVIADKLECAFDDLAGRRSSDPGSEGKRRVVRALQRVSTYVRTIERLGGRIEAFLPVRVAFQVHDDNPARLVWEHGPSTQIVMESWERDGEDWMRVLARDLDRLDYRRTDTCNRRRLSTSAPTTNARTPAALNP